MKHTPKPERSAKFRKILDARPSLWVRQGNLILLILFLLVALVCSLVPLPHIGRLLPALLHLL